MVSKWLAWFLDPLEAEELEEDLHHVVIRQPLQGLDTPLEGLLSWGLSIPTELTTKEAISQYIRENSNDIRKKAAAKFIIARMLLPEGHFASTSVRLQVIASEAAVKVQRSSNEKTRARFDAIFQTSCTKLVHLIAYWKFLQGSHSTETNNRFIYLVHGTWPRGFIQAIIPLWSRISRSGPCWFEDGSEFRGKLLDNTPVDINVNFIQHEWSGDNSFIERAIASEKLANVISENVDHHPSAHHIVIGHSHGGNVALRSITMLNQRTASQLSIITLATPFLQLFIRNKDTVLKTFQIMTYFVVPIFIFLYAYYLTL